MASLLGLPRELRDQIIDLVVTARISTPPCPTSATAAASSPRALCKDFKFDNSSYEAINVAYLTSPDAYQPNALALMLANHQLHHETQSRLRSVNPSLELDVKVVGEQVLYPTWIRIPRTYPLELVDVDVTVQACGKRPDEWRKTRWGTRWSSQLPKSLQLAFTGLLVRFLRVGPVGPISDEFLDVAKWHRGDVTINELRVNIVAPDKESGAKGDRASACYIADAIAGRMQVLTQWYPVNYGTLAYQRINRVLIAMDGEPVKTFDLAKQLKLVPHLERAIHFSDGESSSPRGPGYRNAKELDIWWREVRNEREDHGLEAPDEEGLSICDEEELMRYRKEVQR